MQLLCNHVPLLSRFQDKDKQEVKKSRYQYASTSATICKMWQILTFKKLVKLTTYTCEGQSEPTDGDDQCISVAYAALYMCKNTVWYFIR